MKRPAANSATAPAPKRAKKQQSVYASFKGKSIPERGWNPVRAPPCSTKIIAWNVAGLRALLANRSSLLKKLVATEKPAILGFLEHKLQEGQQVEDVTRTLNTLLPEYTLVKFATSKKRLGYSGVAVLIHKALAAKARVTPIVLEKQADEGRMLCVELPNLFVVITYVMNSGDGLVRLKERLGEWDANLRSYVQCLAKMKPTVVLGDMNVAHQDKDIWNLDAPHVPKSASTTPEERASFGKLLDSGFVDGFSHFHPSAHGAFTYWSIRAGNRKPNRGLRLDYVIASKQMVGGKAKGAKLVDAFHLPKFAPNGDHCPVGAVVHGV